MSAFETAVIDSKKLTSKPSNDELLNLYGSSSSSPLYTSAYLRLQSFFQSNLQPRLERKKAERGVKVGIISISATES
jgi:hypothetical protein